MIFHGVKETTDATSDVDEPDLEMIKEVINQDLHMDAARHVESVVRIGKLIEGKTRPVRVKFNTQESRNNVLKRAKDLKDSNEFKRIYVSPDLTRKQQLIDKDLRDHVKQFRQDGQENVSIRGGKVVKNVGGRQESILYDPQALTTPSS